MTPYIKKIVELHKIHKAVEEKDCCNGGGSTPSGDIGYEEIYQFYAKQIKNIAPAGFQAIFPDTFNDIINFENNVYPGGTFGIWKVNIEDIAKITPSSILFATISQDGPEDFIIFGQSINPGITPE